MSYFKDEIEFTRTMRWHELVRAAVMFGIIDGYSYSNNMHVRQLLVKQMQEGRVQQVTQGHPVSTYRAKLKWKKGPKK